ncbi:hypothetical protein [Flagellimonas okinawensis]|uniref:DUF4783 domain-containing protein n=1 Tax=Flagellimonas okinawensis TaxID=3031324 RepID=A0ABT5XLF2_9FLAO|nr:hypothetical protein [[Muricauda] okinawensis]MDF0706647.1 hypothetical protein [[Muricauda] okinawensis]
MTVKLSEIFIKKSSTSTYSKDELSSLDIKKEFIKRLSKYYDIPYKAEGSKENNLCYANSGPVRFVYRSTFSKKDIKAHLFTSLNKDTFHLDTTKVTFY